ncbi:proteophosphoglycan ppg4 [Lentinula edodes]|uniref:Mediator of RNA polymerase II transcription subunit 13 n=1 Tax=Lentinula edodes TaxID=5353 RepID=A0A1Q3EGG1_LENED|nr:proteophosphoglycan ppg4 [Lentinula edodes]
MDSHTNRSGTLSNNDLLRAHRVASTASRLFALASPSPVNTPAAVPTPGVPTPGTVSVPTPGGRSSPSSLPLMNIPGSTTSTLHQTAAEVSAYVEYVAREREKERERLKEVQAQRNRVTSSSSVANSGASTSASSNSNFGLRSVPPISIPPSIPPPFTGAIMHSGTDAQLFYPSPPTNPPSVSAAGVAVSPTAYQGTALLPQIPQGLPSMHDASVASSRISPSVSGTTSEVNKIVEGIMDISTIEISHDTTQGPLPETDASGTDIDNGIVNTGLPLTNVSAPPLVTTERLSSAPMTAPEPIVRSAPATNSDPTSGWTYFGSEGADFDGLGMLGNVGMNGIDNLTGNGMTTDNVDMTLFGAGGGNTFNFENLDSFGGGMDWNMDSTFSFGSGLTPSTSTSDQVTKSSTGVHTGMYADTRSTNTSFSSFQSADVFSQPMPPPTAPAVTAPTQTNASGTQQLGGGPGSGLGIGMDFEADFTDDDFSFFDNKASNTVNPVEPTSDSLILSASAPPNAATSPDPLAFLNSDDSSSFFSSLGLAPPLPIGSAPTPGFYGYPSHPTPFSISHPTPGGPTGFTPLTVDVEVEVEMNPGLPSPPEETNHPFARAYEVQLEQGTETSPFRLSSVHTPPPTLTSYSPPAPSSPSKDKKFAPIPFAKSHSQADGKYRVAGGKFALLRNSGRWLHKKYRPAYFTLDAPRRARAASWTGIMQGESSNGCFGEQVDLSEKDSRINGPSQGRWCLPSPPVDSDTTDSSAGESDDDQPHTSLEPPPPPTSISDASPPPPGSTDISMSSSYTHKTSRPGWRPRYDRATDPRIGVVRRLTGSKQRSKKRLKRAGWSEIHTRPKWLKDWEDDTGRHIDVANTGQSQEDEAEDDEDEDGGTADEEQDTDGGTLEELDDTPDMKASRRSGGREWSRSATPLPAYLPPGPSLVSTCFHWVHLASMAVGDNVSQTSTIEGMIHDSAPTPIHLNRGVGTTHGAPTPVSPVALAGSSAASFPTPAPTWPQALTPSADIDFIPTEEEKAWSLETAVNCIAQECVENPFWADAWKSMDEFMAWSPPTPESTPKMTSSTQTSRPICSSGSTPSTSSCILTPLSPPLLSVAKSEAIIHIMPAALRFWDKLGLGPKSGKKDVTVFVLYEQGYPEAEQHDRLGKAKIWRDEQIGFWLRNACALYKVKRLGEMFLGKSSLCQKDGLVSFQFGTSFRRSLTSFIASLPAPRDSFVFFILVPLAVMNLASETLHHVSSTINKVLSQYSEVQAVFQLIPEPYVLNTVVHPSSLHDFRSESFVHSVYNRILIPTDRAMSRKFFTYGQREKRYFEVPAFTLAHSLSENKVSYSSSVDPALDVLDRHTFLHVGYRISLCGRWILAACIDQRGEAHAMGVWSTQPYTPTDKNKKNDDSGVDVPVISDEMYIVNKVWDFAMQLAEKANVEWRIVIAKSGNMSVIELDAWITHLYTALHSNVQAPMHVSLLNVEQSVPWIILPFPAPQSTGHSAPNSKNPTLFRSTPGSVKISSKNQFFVDTATTTYGLLQKDTLPISVPPTLNDIGLSTDLVINKPLSIDDDDYSLVDDYPLLPLSSSTLICIPDSSVLPQMVNIHLIYATKSEECAYPNITSDAADSPQNLLHDITNSFYSLSVLSTARRDIAGTSLPFHLSAVETMRKALSTRNGVDSIR